MRSGWVREAGGVTDKKGGGPGKGHGHGNMYRISLYNHD